MPPIPTPFLAKGFETKAFRSVESLVFGLFRIKKSIPNQLHLPLLC